MAAKMSVYGAGGVRRDVSNFTVYGAGGIARKVQNAWVYGAGGTPRLFYQSVFPVVPWTWRFNGPNFTNAGSTGPCVSAVTGGGYSPMGSLSLVGGTSPDPNFRVAHWRGSFPNQLWLWIGSTLNPNIANSAIRSINGNGLNALCSPAGFDSAIGGYLYIFNPVGFAILQNSNYDIFFSNPA